jgi:hypothetical protein
MSIEHAPDPHAAPAHDQEAEVAHAWEHFRENAVFFAGFLCLVVAAVVQFEFSAEKNFYWIFFLGALRFTLIGFFMYSLVKKFSLIVATFIFTVLFFIGMVYFSMWGSQVPHVGDPIIIRTEKPSP